MIDKIKQIEISAKEKINAAKNSNEIEELRVAFLGKKGKVVEVLKNLKNVDKIYAEFFTSRLFGV